MTRHVDDLPGLLAEPQVFYSRQRLGETAAYALEWINAFGHLPRQDRRGLLLHGGTPAQLHLREQQRFSRDVDLIGAEHGHHAFLDFCAGHYAVPAVVKLGPEEGGIALHSGISVVTPASAILEITRRPEHVEWREAEIARLSAAVDGTEPAVNPRALGVTLGRRVVQVVGVLVILAGAVFALQGMALLPSRIMYSRPEWVVIGAVLVLSGVVLLWRARGAS